MEFVAFVRYFLAVFSAFWLGFAQVRLSFASWMGILGKGPTFC